MLMGTSEGGNNTEVLRVWLLGCFRVSVGSRTIRGPLAAEEGGSPGQAARPGAKPPMPTLMGCSSPNQTLRWEAWTCWLARG
jgi:hypothetical protein